MEKKNVKRQRVRARYMNSLPGADGGRREGIFTRLFYDEAGNEVEADQGQGVMPLDPRKRFMDRPDAAPEYFIRGVDLDG